MDQVVDPRWAKGVPVPEPKVDPRVLRLNELIRIRTAAKLTPAELIELLKLQRDLV